MQYEFAILHNPFARHSLDRSIFEGVPQFVEDGSSSTDTTTMSWHGPVPEWWD
jgi:hypothetical protein